VIYKLRELRGIDELGRHQDVWGAWTCKLEPADLTAEAYGANRDQRTPTAPLRNFNREYEALLTEADYKHRNTEEELYWRSRAYQSLLLSGCPFHPEFKSKPMEPHQLFTRL